MPEIDVGELVSRLVSGGQTEADIQSDIRLLLISGALNLDDGDLFFPELEAQLGDGTRRRIDIEVGFTIIEVKRRLSDSTEAERNQLAGYMATRAEQTGGAYTGILTDGRSWQLYRLEDAGGAPSLAFVSQHEVDRTNPDADRLVAWLENVMSTLEQIPATPASITGRLGAGSNAFLVDVGELSSIFASVSSNTEVALKRELWSRLLFASLGTSFTDDDDLFVSHTYLVLVAELVAHRVVGLPVTDPDVSIGSLLAGERFAASGIGGVVEPDFFDWPGLSPAGERFVRRLAHRINRFDWTNVDHDVLKALYESVIDDRTRHQLGEYYTPDWLAERIVGDVVDEPLTQRVLDPSCGSGTFVFFAVRHYLRAADEVGLSNEDSIRNVAQLVMGVDLHPVAATLARVTYLMAIGTHRLQHRPAFTVPIYLGDSIQMSDETFALDAGSISIPTTVDQMELFAQQIRFPAAVVAEASKFDPLVSELAARAQRRTADGKPPRITSVMNAHGVSDEDRPAIEEAYRILCALKDANRDHVWGYYIRNLARPVWLSQSGNRADRLVGNPPWLRFNAMPERMRTRFQVLNRERGLSASAAVATSQDLAGLFVARSIELYLKVGGRFGFVMPASVLSRQHYQGFRKGVYSAPLSVTTVAFDVPWNLTDVQPNIFPVPSCVVFGKRTDVGAATPLSTTTMAWSGNTTQRHRRWSEVESELSTETAEVRVDDGGSRGVYGDMMRQGSNLVPRVLVMVDPQPAPALGLPQGQMLVRSHRSNNERAPWRDITSLQHPVESKFVMPIHLGETLMPFRLLEPKHAVIPVAGGAMLELGSDELDEHQGLATWWAEAEAAWRRHRGPNTTMALSEQLNYQQKLVNQFPIAPVRIVYTGRGSRVAAAVETDTSTIIDHALYWAAVESEIEAHYLAGLLNSDELHEQTEAMYSRGLLGARNIHRAAFGVPVPAFDPTDPGHSAVVEAAKACHAVAAEVSADESTTARNRMRFREALTSSGQMKVLNASVKAVLAGAASMIVP